MTRAIGSLCSGYGGLDAAAEQLTGGKVAWVSDIDKGACKILAHHYPDVPNLGDFTTTDWADVEPIHMLTAGYPCQPFSHAGKRAGTNDARHLWPYVLRCLTALRPPFALFENVRGHLSLGFDQVLADLATHDYDARWIVLRAADIGAPHGRARLFILAADARRGGDRWDLVGAGRGTVRVGGVRGEDPDRGRDAGGADLLGGVTLLPTPAAASDGNTPETHLARKPGRTQVTNLEVMARGGLLPTPAASAGEKGRAYGQDPDIRRNLGRQVELADITCWELLGRTRLLPTPAVADVQGGRKARSGVRNDEPLLNGIAAGNLWGDYADAIRRWERILGRPAPEPTQFGSRGNPQLAPAFVEWMMGLPEGWVDDVPDLSRNEKLKALGNGVVTQQAVEGVRRLLALTERVAA